MGDWFQTIVDVEASPAEAELLATEVRDWLISTGVVAADRTDSVLGADLGHPPGPHVDRVLQPTPDVGWRELWTNGLDIVTGRTVFDCGQGEPMGAACPYCGDRVALVDDRYQPVDEAWEPFGDAFEAWLEGDGGALDCPACARKVDPQDWRWDDDYFALGCLGFTFWNWPDFRPEFIAEVGRRLGGHRVVLVAGKL